MIEVNCAALPRDLLESELFGHEAGPSPAPRDGTAACLEQADGGTLFLDEIGEMDLDLQSKLLTAIEDRVLRRLGGEKSIKVDVQVIAASNRDLERQVREGAIPQRPVSSPERVSPGPPRAARRAWRISRISCP